MSNEKIQWLHDAATEFASTGMKMTMNPDEVLQLTTPLLALRKERDRAVPVAIIDQANLDYLKSGADADVWPPERAEMGDMPLYTAPPAPVVPKIDRKAICNKAHWLCARSPGATFYNAAEFALDEVAELLAPPTPVVPDGLRIALSNAGIAAPESDEMLWASQQDYIQMLVTWVKDRKPFKPAAVPDETFDEWSRRCEIQLTLCRPEFREVAEISWNACRAAMLAAPGKEG